MPTSSNQPARAPLALNVIGWAVAGAALLLTAWSGMRVGNAFVAGQRVGQLIGTWLIMMLVAWLFTRNSAPSTRAWGRIAVSVLLWLVVAFNLSADAREKAIGQGFLRDAIALNNVHQQKIQALNERFSHADLSTVLTPANVTSAAGIAKGRQQVAQFRQLIAARDALLVQNMDEVRRLVAGLPDGPTKFGATATVGKRRAENGRVFKELTRTQLAHLELVGQILDWCAGQDGKISSDGERLLYKSHEQAAELKVLLDKLALAGAAADKASEAATQVEQHAEERKAQSLKQATELLK